MISSVLKEHSRRQDEQKALIDEKKAAVGEKIDQYTQVVTADASRIISRVHFQQKAIEDSCKTLHALTDKQQKASQKWLGALKDFHQCLKELGDVETWTLSIERDLAVVTESLEKIAEQKAAGPSA